MHIYLCIDLGTARQNAVMKQRRPPQEQSRPLLSINPGCICLSILYVCMYDLLLGIVYVGIFCCSVRCL